MNTSQYSATRPVEILLVEDNPADVRLMVESLKGIKIRNHLQVARGGTEALDILYQRGQHESKARPDAILLDLNMPGVDGREVLRQIKNDPSLRSIPVVVMTSSEAESDILRSYDLHANCYVSKPIDFETFTQVVKNVEHFWFEVVKLPEPTTLENNSPVS